MKKLFGNILRNLRRNEDEKQEDLAEILNVSKAMVSLWENGKKKHLL